MRPRTLLVLLALVLGLGAFIRFYERSQPSSEERARRAKHVLDFKKDQVTRLRIDAGGAQVLLERRRPPAPAGGAGKKAGQSAAAGGPGAGGQAAEWRLLRPVAAPADASAIDRLLDDLNNLEQSRVLDTVVPADAGLDKPRATIAVTSQGEGGKAVEKVVKVGAAVPTGGSLILAVSGQPGAFVVGDSILAELSKKPEEWRDRQLFHGERDSIERIAVDLRSQGGQGAQGGGARLLLARRGDRFWIESPFADRADRDQVEKLLSDLTGLTAERFLDQPPPPPAKLAEYGLQPPRAVVEVVLAGRAQPLRIELGSSRPATAPASPSPATPGSPPPAPETTGTLTYARLGGEICETRSPLAETIARPAAAWRSPTLAGLEVHQIESAVVRDAKGALSLSRSGTDWKRGKEAISYLPVSELLFAVTEAKADKILDPAEARPLAPSLATPLLTFELKGGLAGNDTLTLYPVLAGNPQGLQGVPARAASRAALLLLPASKLKEIQEKVDALRAAKPLPPEKPAQGKAK
ncbi:MAG TPA: DUF4340 domain-containing protein [Thermoanaerobaculia bacterium]|nr:DUF4340 domain-containing protein [Thermoanaerobaculia bacterium]